MEEKKLLFLYHAGSGKGKIKSKLSDILDLFVSAGYTVTVRPTQARGDATEYIARYGKEYEASAGIFSTLTQPKNGQYLLVEKTGEKYPINSLREFSFENNSFPSLCGISPPKE